MISLINHSSLRTFDFSINASNEGDYVSVEKIMKIKKASQLETVGQMSEEKSEKFGAKQYMQTEIGF